MLTVPALHTLLVPGVGNVALAAVLPVPLSACRSTVPSQSRQQRAASVGTRCHPRRTYPSGRLRGGDATRVCHARVVRSRRLLEPLVEPPRLFLRVHLRQFDLQLRLQPCFRLRLLRRRLRRLTATTA